MLFIDIIVAYLYKFVKGLTKIQISAILIIPSPANFFSLLNNLLYCVYMKKHTLTPHQTLSELIAIKNVSADEGQKLRLLAIINIKKGKLIKQVAEELIVSRRSVSSWQNIYNDKGVAGLATNKGGRPEGNPKWDLAIWEALGKNIKTTGGYWSIPKMQEWITATYHQNIPEQTVWYHLDQLGFSYKSARPHPYQGNFEQQAAFKKKASRKRWAL